MFLFREKRCFLRSNIKRIPIKRSRVLISMMLVLSLFFSACQSTVAKQLSQGQSAPEIDPNKKTIFTTIYSVYDFTKKIAADDFNLRLLMPPGTEAHDWEPGPQDMTQLSLADALIFSGAGIEPWVEQIAAAGSSDLIIVDSSKNVRLIPADTETEYGHKDESEEEHAEHAHGLFDPHIWLDPQNVKIQMKNIADALIQVDPSKKESIEERLNREYEKLDALNKTFADALLPYAGKTIIVGHEAFAYLFEAYNLKQIGIEGLLASSEPSPGHMAELVKLAKAEAIKVVYIEPLSSTKTAESLANEFGGSIEFLDPFEGLTAEEEAAGKDYYNVMESNLNALLTGFDNK